MGTYPTNKFSVIKDVSIYLFSFTISNGCSCNIKHISVPFSAYIFRFWPRILFWYITISRTLVYLLNRGHVQNPYTILSIYISFLLPCKFNNLITFIKTLTVKMFSSLNKLITKSQAINYNLYN